MLSFASDFWPLFWTIVGTGALVVVLLSVLVAAYSPAWFRREHGGPPTERADRNGHRAGEYARAA